MNDLLGNIFAIIFKYFYSTFAPVQSNNSFIKFVSKFISILFHPVFIPTLVLSFLVFFIPNLFVGFEEKDIKWWILIVAYITITFPLLVVFLLWRLKFIDSIYMKGDKERYIPLIASMLFYFWTFWLFHKQFHAPNFVQSFLLGTFLTTVGVFISTLFFKISMHTAAIGSVLGFSLLLALFPPHHFGLLFIAIICTILVSFSRLFLKAHHSFEVISGMVLGFIFQLISYFIILKLF